MISGCKWMFAQLADTGLDRVAEDATDDPTNTPTDYPNEDPNENRTTYQVGSFNWPAL